MMTWRKERCQENKGFGNIHLENPNQTMEKEYLREENQSWSLEQKMEM